MKVKNTESKKRSAQFPGLLFRMNIETSNPLWFIAFQPPTLQPTSTIPPAVPRPQRSIARAQVQRVLCSVVKSTPSLFSWTFESIFDQNLWLFLWKLALCGTTSSLNQFEVIFTPKHHLCYPPVSSATENTLWMEVLVGKKNTSPFFFVESYGESRLKRQRRRFSTLQPSSRHRVIWTETETATSCRPLPFQLSPGCNQRHATTW